jgi:anaerobic magnesium-protoporphyrin IX monomethyl ester cyclase
MNDFIDLVTIGEGERTIVELANVLHEHGMDTQELVKVAGIGFKENGEAVFTRPRPLIKNLDDIYPAWHHLDIERYFYSGKNFYSGLRGEKVIALITSRGCPWRCGYCFNQAVNKRRFRAQSAQRVISEIHDLKERLGITGVLFEDDNFFTDKRRALEIVRSMSIPWTSTMRVDDLAEGGEDFVKTLAQSRCIELRFGAESGSQRVLDLLTKDITVDQIRRTAELCGKHGIKAVFMFMYGFPCQTTIRNGHQRQLEMPMVKVDQVQLGQAGPDRTAVIDAGQLLRLGRWSYPGRTRGCDCDAPPDRWRPPWSRGL